MGHGGLRGGSGGWYRSNTKTSVEALFPIEISLYFNSSPFIIPSLYYPLFHSYINDYPTGRILRDAKLYEIGAGTSEIRRLIIGRALNSHYK